MKRMLACLLILLGFVVVGCEEEEHGHHGFHGREFHEDGFRDHEFHLLNQTTQNDGILQVESTVEP